MDRILPAAAHEDADPSKGRDPRGGERCDAWKWTHHGVVAGGTPFGQDVNMVQPHRKRVGAHAPRHRSATMPQYRATTNEP
jgi:hypothetical protein